jgi:multiple sugar transport system permease protein
MWSEIETQVPLTVRAKRSLDGSVHFVAGVLVALLFLLPLFWTVSVSFREVGQPLPRTLEWVPDPATGENYVEVFNVVRFARFAANSLFVVAFAVPITIAVASMAGFAMAQLARRWRMRLTAASFVALMVPLTAVWLPRFITVKELGLIDSRWALIAPAFFGTSPFYVLLFVWTFARIPRETFEAARLDGAGVLRTWLGIAMPLARPTVMAVAVLAFVRYWSSFIEPLLYIHSTSKMTLPLGLRALVQLDRTNWPLLMAGAVMVTAPVILVFVLAQRSFLDDRVSPGRIGRRGS